MNDIIKCLMERKSIRRFKDTPIEKVCLDEILKCGVAAPNGHNKQTWRFTVLCSQEKIKFLRGG